MITHWNVWSKGADRRHGSHLRATSSAHDLRKALDGVSRPASVEERRCVWERRWLRGGYARPYLARTDEESLPAS